jgi:DNA-binding MarR family transcriptional regulator
MTTTEEIRQLDAELTTWRSVFRALFLVSKRMNRRTDELLQPYGLSLAGLRLLSLLNDRGPLSLGDISELLYYGKSNITRLVDQMESEQLVQRVRDPEDRRSIKAVITGIGKSRLEIAREALEKADWGLSGLTAAQRRDLTRFLENILI